MAVALLFLPGAWGVTPSYSAASIVNAPNGAPGPFAPNSVVSIYGSGLARSTQGLTAADISGGFLPTELNSTIVYVGADANSGVPAPLFYVSDSQINFVLPGNLGPQAPVVRVVREGQSGPLVTLPYASSAPALFTTPAGFVLASHVDYTLVAPGTPAHPGETIVLWVTGLGKTVRDPLPGELPNYTALIQDLTVLRVTLAGVAVDPSRILYAGLTPLAAGLYQINLILPDTTPADPEIRVTVSSQTSAAGAKLAVH